MPTYSVQVPVTGSVIVTVEAESVEAAKAAALDKLDFKVEVGEDCEPGEFESHERVTRGNVCYAACNELHIEEVT